MSHERLASDERRIIAAALDILERLTTRLNAGEPIPNALLGDAVDGLRVWTGETHERCEQESVAGHGGAQSSAAQVQVSEMELALEALERGEAGAAGAFVTHARACVRLLRERAGLELGPQRRSNSDAESTLVPNLTWTAAHSSMLRHFTRLLERYARWTNAGRDTRL
jgi:hypothetical protein